MLVCTNGHGSLSELSLWDSAAKWTIASASATSRSTSSASQMSPTTSCTRSVGRSDKESSLPAYVSLSSTTTDTSVLAMSQRTKFEPMNPAPPVTRILCMADTLARADGDTVSPAWQGGRREGHHPGRWSGHAAPSADDRLEQADAPRVRQADDLLPAVHAHAGRYP